MYEFLRALPSLNNDDVVFMMDAWDVWLQLPPQTLLERYGEYGSHMVVIGADMACWPNEWDEVRAWNVHAYEKPLIFN